MHKDHTRIGIMELATTGRVWTYGEAPCGSQKLEPVLTSGYFRALLTFEWVPNRPHDATRSDGELLSLASRCPPGSLRGKQGGGRGRSRWPRTAAPMSPTERRP
jgi:hypothetical protein